MIERIFFSDISSFYYSGLEVIDFDIFEAVVSAVDALLEDISIGVVHFKLAVGFAFLVESKETGSASEDAELSSIAI